MRILPVNIYKSIKVILAPFKGLSDERFDFDPPGKSMEGQILANTWHIKAFLTHLAWIWVPFHPYFLYSTIVRGSYKKRIIKIPKKWYPPFGYGRHIENVTSGLVCW